SMNEATSSALNSDSGFAGSVSAARGARVSTRGAAAGGRLAIIVAAVARLYGPGGTAAGVCAGGVDGGGLESAGGTGAGGGRARGALPAPGAGAARIAWPSGPTPTPIIVRFSAGERAGSGGFAV